MTTRANCIVYARSLHARLSHWLSKPGRSHWRMYYSKRWSDWGRFKHRLVILHSHYSGAMHIVSWKPIDPRKRRWPPPLFKGQLTWGDRPPEPGKVDEG